MALDIPPDSRRTFTENIDAIVNLLERTGEHSISYMQALQEKAQDLPNLNPQQAVRGAIAGVLYGSHGKPPVPFDELSNCNAEDVYIQVLLRLQTMITHVRSEQQRQPRRRY
jgi:hypothetical protein